MAKDALVIIGGGLATPRAVKAYREGGGEGSVRLVSMDSEIPYHRPPLSKRYLRGEQEKEEVFVEQPGFYDEHEVEVSLETEVVNVDTAGAQVELAGGERVGYEKLLIASGAAPQQLDVPGRELPGVFTLRTVADSTRIREAANGATRAIVVGSGFIGMEVTASLKALGIDVTLVHRGPGLFEVLDAPEVSRSFVELYREKGVDLALEDEIAEFLGDGSLRGARTKNGRELEADLAVVGVGVQPLTAFVSADGIEVDNGIVVNERFETGVPGVYAVGDVANFYDPLFERQRRIEHWSNSNYQGAEVGKILAGADGGYDRVSTFFSEVFGVTIKVFGDTSRNDALVFRGSLAEGKTIGFYLDGDRLVATFVSGQDDDTEKALQELIGRRAEIADRGRLADAEAPIGELFR
jgi:3-phenylpropionate/trans-cinnamate dioxygenase ferredoxin reductase component